MSDTNQWSFPPSLQPKQDDLQFDLGRAMNAVVGLRAEVPEDAFTASILGTDRAGSGVVIREDGLVLTIGGSPRPTGASSPATRSRSISHPDSGW